MRKPLLAAALATSLSLVAGSSASAATEVGGPCTATGTEANRTLLVFGVADGPRIQPTVPEEPPQVITRWKVRVGPGIAPLPQRLEVYRVLNEGEDYRKEAESATVTVSEGLNVFPTRIPVRSFAGYLGLYGPSGTLFCKPAPQLGGSFEGAAAVGETRRIETSIGLGVPLIAIVEDDRDKDGYGDETQDKCPTSAAFQGECPRVTLRASVEAKQKSIVVRARVSSRATVDIYGQVGWGFKPNPKLKTAGSKPTRLIIALSGPKKTLAPGETGTFRVPLPKAVLRRLGRLTPEEFVTAKLAVIATSIANQDFSRKLRVKLKGQAGGS